MISSDIVFILHVPVAGRKLDAVNAFESTSAFICVPPQFHKADMPSNWLPIGFYEKPDLSKPPGVVIARNSIIDYALKNNMTKFWMCDDDVTGIRNSEKKKIKLSDIQFPDDGAYCGLISGGWWHTAVEKPETWDVRKFTSLLFFNYDVLPKDKRMATYYTWEDVDLVAWCVKNGYKSYCHNRYGVEVPGKNVSITSGQNNNGFNLDKARDEQFAKDYPEFCPNGSEPMIRKGKPNKTMTISFKCKSKPSVTSPAKPGLFGF